MKVENPMFICGFQVCQPLHNSNHVSTNASYGIVIGLASTIKEI
jgi:hypothetical protein